VRSLVPGVAPGTTMDDVVQAPFDYDALDRTDRLVRIRLNSTCVHVADSGGKVDVAYVRDGALHRVEARHAVLACFHMMIPHIMPGLPEPQRAALAKNVKTPICYINVLLSNWRAFESLKVNSIFAPMGFHHQVSLDFPVNLGGYRHPRDPSEPILVHMVHVPGAPNQGLDARAQFRAGQAKLLTMTFADFEDRIRDDLDRMLGPGGFSSARDIAAITVNRWSHGYSYVANSLFDPDDYEDSVLKVARTRSGNVAIANTDSGGDAWVHFAIDQADRAVRELVG
jgi:spermidine dehydrogenase